MTSSMQPNCPRTEQLSALIDGELAAGAQEQIKSHAAACPLCGAMLRDLTTCTLHCDRLPLRASA